MTEIQYDPTSRFQVLERPVAHPGKCRCCGSALNKVVDFGADDDEGVIYLCENCIIEAASRFGAVTAQEHQATVSQLNDVLRANEKAGEYANELTTDIGFATSRFFDRIRGLADSESTEASSPDSDESGDSDSENSGDAERTDNKDSKPTRKSRSSSVSATPGDSSVFKPAV
mgnify:CR=1 FL=1